MIGPHLARGPDFFHCGFKVFMDLRIFVLELNLAAAQFDARERAALAVLRTHETKSPVVPAERQVAGRLCAGVEMLMEPSIRRNDDAPGLPIDPLHLLTFRPQYGVA